MAQLDSPGYFFPLTWSKTIAIALAAFFVAAWVARAQSATAPAIEGYILCVSPRSFCVNGHSVLITDETAYGIRSGSTVTSEADLRQKIQMGAYVYVMGDLEPKTRTVTAQTILFRDDLDVKLSGLGVIQRVIARGTNPAFEADGYRIRITPATQIQFADPSLTLAQVGLNSWVKYEGHRNQAGELVASSAEFLPGKLSQQRSVFKLEEDQVTFRPTGSTVENPAELAQGGEQVWGGQVKLRAEWYKGGPNDPALKDLRWHWYTIPIDEALQQRVARIGMSLVPAYQKEMPATDPSKIPFRFYAVDDAKVRTEMCTTDGLVLLPKQMVERLKNDDQLAAVLADGVAYNLQRQAARFAKDNRSLNSLYVAGLIANVLVPGGGFASVGSTIVQGKIEIALEQQRGRVALALMADAGYNPQQAPQAWRLLAPKRLPANPQSLGYPSLSVYQLAILNLQYNAERATAPEKIMTEAALSNAP